MQEYEDNHIIRKIAAKKLFGTKKKHWVIEQFKEHYFKENDEIEISKEILVVKHQSHRYVSANLSIKSMQFNELKKFINSEKNKETMQYIKLNNMKIFMLILYFYIHTTRVLDLK